MSYRDLKNYVHKNYKKGKCEFFEVNRSYQDTLKGKLGGLKGKYFSLLKKAVPFTPITNIESFITEYVCDIKGPIDISLMQDNKIHVWIYRITRNTITDYYRNSSKKLEVTGLPENLESGTDEELSANTEIAACLKVMIDNLPQNYKQAILLTEFQNMTQKELSDKLGISISGAKSRVQRARKMLKEMLLGCCHLETDRRGNIIEYKHKKNKCKYC